jgi:hypothetical protein
VVVQTFEFLLILEVQSGQWIAGLGGKERENKKEKPEQLSIE